MEWNVNSRNRRNEWTKKMESQDNDNMTCFWHKFSRLVVILNGDLYLFRNKNYFFRF